MRLLSYKCTRTIWRARGKRNSPSFFFRGVGGCHARLPSIFGALRDIDCKGDYSGAGVVEIVFFVFCFFCSVLELQVLRPSYSGGYQRE